MGPNQAPDYRMMDKLEEIFLSIMLYFSVSFISFLSDVEASSDRLSPTFSLLCHKAFFTIEANGHGFSWFDSYSASKKGSLILNLPFLAF